LSTQEEVKRAEWLAARRNMITGTDVAAILGLSPFRAPIDVWLDKKGLAPELPDSDQLEFGREFQTGILNLYSRRLSAPIEHDDPYAVTPVADFPLLGASLDAHRLDDGRPVDAKNVRQRDTEKWGDTGSTEFPEYYRLQLTIQMMALKAGNADLAVCFGGCAFSWYTIERGFYDENIIKESVEDWWKRYVVANEAPPVDGSDSYADYLKAKFFRHSKPLLEASIDDVSAAQQLHEAKRAQAEIDARIQLLENKLKWTIGDSAGIAGIGTWKNNKDRNVTDWESAARSMRDLVSPEHFNQIVAEHTKPVPGARVFRFNPKPFVLELGQ
jgi:putative phage-type endonuclease